MPQITDKKYQCRRCGHETQQATNHYGPTYSWGRYNTCPACPPWAKYPEFGGATVWNCCEQPEQEQPTKEEEDAAASVARANIAAEQAKWRK